MAKSQQWFEEKVFNYHGDKVTVKGEYIGSVHPIEVVYHCERHGDTTTIVNAKNICKPFFLPCKQCQSERKSNSFKNRSDDKNFYYKRLADYCAARGGTVLETEWTRAKDTYHFKCSNPDHPVFTTTADALYSGEHWCPYCSGRSGNFEDEIRKICEEYGGELVGEYVSSTEYVTVKCNKHNYTWDIMPNNIKRGRWCPVCNMGFNEKVVWDYLTNNLCNFRIQYTYPDLAGKNGELLKFDFAVFDLQDDLISLIEVDDEEHRYKQHGNSLRQIQRREAQERDNIKDAYCKSHNISLYRMEVPFHCGNKWSYEDYYRYVNTELKEIVNKSRIGVRL